jgi:ribosome maturation factor RimP
MAGDPQETAAQLIAAARPDVYLWDVVADPGHRRLQVTIDREGGVGLDLCEEITRVLAPLREEWALEVSSPGLDASLVRPAHYARRVGREVAVVLRAPVADRTALEGVIAAAGPDTFTVESGGEHLEVPYADVKKSTLMWKLVKSR